MDKHQMNLGEGRIEVGNENEIEYIYSRRFNLEKRPKSCHT